MTYFFSVIYTMLKRKYKLVDLKTSSDDLVLKYPTVYRGTAESGIIYIVEKASEFVPPENAAESVFLFCDTDAISIDFTPGMRAILVGSCHDPCSLLSYLTQVFLQLEIWNGKCAEFIHNDSNLSDMLVHFYALCPHRLIFEDENYKHIYEFPQFTTAPSDQKLLYPDDTSASPENPKDATFSQFTSFVNADIVYEPTFSDKIRVLFTRATGNIVLSRRVYGPDSTLLGRLVLKYDESSAENRILLNGFCRLLDIFAQHFEKKLAISLTGSSGQESALHRSLLKLITSPAESHNLRKYLQFLPSVHWGPTDTFLIVTINIASRSLFAETSGYIRSYVEKLWDNCIAIRHDNNVIIIFNFTLHPNQTVDEIVETLSVIRQGQEDLFSTVTISNFFFNIVFAPHFYNQCKYLLQLKSGNHSDQWLYQFSNYSADHLAEYLISIYPLAYLCHEGVLTLYRYDKENGSELLWTLYNYIKYHQNASLASDSISVHRTTFIKRMEKITSLASFNFDSTDEIMIILLSIKMLNFYSTESADPTI